MATYYSPKIVTDGLQIYLDATNYKSYVGSGTTWTDLANNDSYASSYYTYPSIASNGGTKYFSFVNNGTTVNNIYNSSPVVSTYTQAQYTRLAWFNMTSNSNAWSPIIQNEIGNNSDMGLTVANNRLHFRHYTKTYTSGTTDGDYGVSGTLAVNTNTWYLGTIVVNKTATTVSFYLNGQFDSSISINVIGNASSNKVIIGGAATDSYNGDRMFKGYIGAVYHYNRLLSASEILQIYNASKSRFGL